MGLRQIHRRFNQARLTIIGIAVIAAVGSATFEFAYAIPKANCERSGGLWAWKWRACAREIKLQAITGRPSPPPVAPETH